MEFFSTFLNGHLVSLTGWLGKEAVKWLSIGRTKSIPPSLTGTWICFLVDCNGMTSDVVTEHLKIDRDTRSKLKGEFTCPGRPERPPFPMRAKVIDDIVSGEFYARREGIAGDGIFQLKANHNWLRLEGFCIWLDFESNEPECSRNIWIRQGDVNSKELTQRAQQDIEKYRETLQKSGQMKGT